MSLKTLREDLSRHQVGGAWTSLPFAVQNLIASTIAVIDVHRPLGPDGKHGDLHTETCGCADKPHRKGNCWCGSLHHYDEFL